jgi:hypothetical protein
MFMRLYISSEIIFQSAKHDPIKVTNLKPRKSTSDISSSLRPSNLQGVDFNITVPKPYY